MHKTDRTQKRQRRTRAKFVGTKEMPRLSVYRSNRAIYAQLIDDGSAKTLVGVSEKQLEKVSGSKTEKAKTLGLLLAKKALDAKIKKAVFDRGSYQYHGRVKALAEGAREGGLQF